MQALALRQTSPRQQHGLAGTQRLKVLAQIQACVQLAYLRLVAVKQKRFTLFGKQAAFANAALGLLAPARVLHIRVHV